MANDIAHLALSENTVLVQLRDGSELSLLAMPEGLAEALALVGPSSLQERDTPESLRGSAPAKAAEPAENASQELYR